MENITLLSTNPDNARYQLDQLAGWLYERDDYWLGDIMESFDLVEDMDDDKSIYYDYWKDALKEIPENLLEPIAKEIWSTLGQTIKTWER